MTNSRAEQVTLVLDGCTNFKRKRSLKEDRVTFCTEWISAFEFLLHQGNVTTASAFNTIKTMVILNMNTMLLAGIVPYTRDL